MREYAGQHADYLVHMRCRRMSQLNMGDGGRIKASWKNAYPLADAPARTMIKLHLSISINS
jgi:hypothetical protein